MAVTIIQNPGKVVAWCVDRPEGSVTSTQRGTPGTLGGAVKGLGSTIPPHFMFPCGGFFACDGLPGCEAKTHLDG